MFIGMNPSTADAMFNDPTVSREIFFAKREGFGGIIKVNVMDVRLTNSKKLTSLDFPVCSDLNLKTITAAAMDPRSVGFAVAAWGRLHKDLQVHARRVFAILACSGMRLMCFGRNKDGSPKHPLYLRADTALEPFNG